MSKLKKKKHTEGDVMQLRLEFSVSQNKLV